MTSSLRSTTAGVLARVRNDPAYGAFLLLRAGFTALPILMGVDKFFNLLTTSPATWEGYPGFSAVYRWSRCVDKRKCLSCKG